MKTLQPLLYAFSPLFIAFLCDLNFYWKTVSTVIFMTFTYCGFVFPCLPAKCQPLGVLGILLLCLLLLSLSPVHIFFPTPLDLWTEYSDHPPLESFNTLYDPGEIAVVE